MPGAELRRRHDRLAQLHGRLAGMVLERVADLVRDHGGGRHRQARVRSVTPTRRRSVKCALGVRDLAR